MAIKLYQPTTPGRRHASVLVRGISKNAVVKSLVKGQSKSAGRNNQGKITVRHRGGGAKQLLRIVDSKRTKYDMSAKVIAISYDPQRTANLALLQCKDGVKTYIIAPEGLKVGMEVVSSREVITATIGNRLLLKHVPAGLAVHDVELVPGDGGVLAKSAGSQILVTSVEAGHARLKMPSSEIRLVSDKCSATIGQVCNIDHLNVRLGTAGRRRHQGFRPSVRGKAMNPVDHPHGGGEGHNPIGMKHPKTPWGKPALGVPTRPVNKASSKFIISRRPKRV